MFDGETVPGETSKRLNHSSPPSLSEGYCVTWTCLKSDRLDSSRRLSSTIVTFCHVPEVLPSTPDLWLDSRGLVTGVGGRGNVDGAESHKHKKRVNRKQTYVHLNIKPLTPNLPIWMTTQHKRSVKEHLGG